MKNKSVIKMNNIDAKKFFIKGANYCNIELPEYFDFEPLITDIDKRLNGKKLSDFNKNGMDIRKMDNVNCILLNNKDGQFAWRPYEIIHPAIYVQLVNDITKKENWKLICNRVKTMQNNKKIICCSIPFENYDYNPKKDIILNWWKEFEQQSISFALEYEYIGCTDITDCYGSLYTHTIAWAIHTKSVAKTSRDTSLIGNKIDSTIQSMHYNQTNGIPQGSVLMDFIAELVLAYADNELSMKLKKNNIIDYKILRYRDDYKIFAHDVSTINKILKCLTEVLFELNFKINSQKTIVSNDIIENSIKKDKIYSIENLSNDSISLQKFLLLSRNFVKIYNSSGTIITILKNFYINKIISNNKKIPYAREMISILVDIMIINPKTYGICCTIISKLLLSLNKTEKKSIIRQIKQKFSKISNTNYLEIWIQRLTIYYEKNEKYNSNMCKKLYEKVCMWNSDWTNLPIKEELIINKDKLKNIKSVIDINEIKLKDTYDY